jgi:hypothetical protein
MGGFTVCNDYGQCDTFYFAPAPSINILDSFNDIVTLKDTQGELVGIIDKQTTLINILAAIVNELAIKSDPTGTNAALQLKLNALQLKLAASQPQP